MDLMVGTMGSRMSQGEDGPGHARLTGEGFSRYAHYILPFENTESITINIPSKQWVISVRLFLQVDRLTQMVLRALLGAKFQLKYIP